MRLDELFDNALEFTKDGDDYNFITPEGKEGQVTIEVGYCVEMGNVIERYIRYKYLDRNTLQNYFDNHATSEYNKLFKSVGEHFNKKTTEISFSINGESEITGGGEANIIFATVIKIIQQYIAEHNPPIIYLTAFEENRQNLYRRMIRILAKNYTVAQEDVDFAMFSSEAMQEFQGVVKQVETLVGGSNPEG